MPVSFELNAMPKKMLVIFKGDKIEILQQVHFATGKATILPKSFPLLNQVASVIRSHPNIPGITVEGHTDDQGRARRNMELSRDRAASVVNYLVGHGIAQSRLSSAGFGATRPAMPGRSEEARARNRRVDFIITGGPDAAPAAPEPADEHHSRHRRRH
jgi:outer membrane protein OmpA-like peptidoglycan-associated protein